MLFLFTFPAMANGAFRIPGSAVSVLRQQLKALPGGVNGPQTSQTMFTFDPTSRTLVTSRLGSKVASVTLQPSKAVSNALSAAVTINGRVALAILHGMAERTLPINAQLIAKERSGDFLIVGYDHGTSVFFAEEFPSNSNSGATPNALALDTCTPNISYIITLPSYHIQKLTANYCGQYN